VIVYPTIEDVVLAHERLITAFGEAQGIRDRRAPESALARPRTGYDSSRRRHYSKAYRRTIHSSTAINGLRLP
jgi:prophage maintenance system killer protein